MQDFTREKNWFLPKFNNGILKEILECYQIRRGYFDGFS